jgi:hypothetical protein
VGILRGNSYYAKKLSFVSMGFIEEFKSENESRLKQYRILENGAKMYDNMFRDGY